MKKGIALLLCVLVCASGLSFFLTSCNKIPYKPLFSEDGIYLEENFIYNAALKKRKGFKLIEDGKTDCSIVYEATEDNSILMAIEDLENYFKEICGGIEVKTDDNPVTGKEIIIGKTNREYDSKGDLTKVGAYIVDIRKEAFIFTPRTLTALQTAYTALWRIISAACL